MPVASLAGVINLPMEYIGYDISNPSNYQLPQFTSGNKAGFGNTANLGFEPFYFVNFDAKSWRGVYCANQSSLASKANNFVVTDGMFAYLSVVSNNSAANYAFASVKIPNIKNEYLTLSDIPISTLVPPNNGYYQYDCVDTYGIGFDGQSVALGEIYTGHASNVWNVSYGDFANAENIALPFAFNASNVTLFNGFVALSYYAGYSSPTYTLWGSATAAGGQPENFSFDNAAFNTALKTYGLQNAYSVSGGFLIGLEQTNGNFVYVYVPGWGFGEIYYIVNFLPTDAASEAILASSTSYYISVTDSGDVFLGQAAKSFSYNPGVFTLLKNAKLAGTGGPLALPVGSPFSFNRLCCNTANGTR